MPNINKRPELIRRRLHPMTPRIRHAAHTARAAADLSRVTDRLTATANIGNNSQHIMHSMQPKTAVYVKTVCIMSIMSVKSA